MFAHFKHLNCYTVLSYLVIYKRPLEKDTKFLERLLPNMILQKKSIINSVIYEITTGYTLRLHINMNTLETKGPPCHFWLDVLSFLWCNPLQH